MNGSEAAGPSAFRQQDGSKVRVQANKENVSTSTRRDSGKTPYFVDV